PTLFETRWCMSYLAGPMTREQIRALSPPSANPAPAPATSAAPVLPSSSSPPTLPPSIQPYFPQHPPHGAHLVPYLLAAHQITYTDSRLKLHHLEEAIFAIPLAPETTVIDWNQATLLDHISLDDLSPTPPPQVSFAPAPTLTPKTLTTWQREWTAWLSHHHPLTLLRSPSTGLVSSPGEDERSFRLRLNLALREQRDRDLDTVHEKYARRLQTLEARLQRARQRLETRKAQASQARMNAALSIGTTVLGALFGRRAISTTSVTRASAAARNVSRTFKGSQDIAHANESVEAVQAEMAALQAELDAELARIHDGPQALDEVLEPLPIRAPRTRITLRLFTPAWL
ncbi:MAG: hypothetical protein SNJ84_02665, partial [Verrucomicrobiia bacterium]